VVRRGLGRYAAWGTALAGAVVLTFLLSTSHSLPDARRAVLAVPGHQTYPDCRTGRADSPLSHEILHCWHYGDQGAWRVSSVVSAHRALVVESAATGAGVVDELATWMIGLCGGRYDEVLIYVTALDTSRGRGDGSAPVTRVRWTRRGGFSSLVFDGPG
jgi:hypothetical protein